MPSRTGKRRRHSVQTRKSPSSRTGAWWSSGQRRSSRRSGATGNRDSVHSFFRVRSCASDVSQQDTALDPLECETQRIACAGFPESLPSPLNSLESERRMPRILLEPRDCPPGPFAIPPSKLPRGALEARAEVEDQRRSLRMSSFAERASFTRPRLMSSSASRSARCHSSVQK